MIEYLKQVDNLLQLIHACRSGDWDGFLAALECLIKYFFVHDLLNYTRLMPVTLAQMNALKFVSRTKSSNFAKNRPELVPRLEETISECEMAVVLRSLCTVDGCLFIPTDKASLKHLIEEANPQPQIETSPGTGNQQ